MGVVRRASELTGGSQRLQALLRAGHKATLVQPRFELCRRAQHVAAIHGKGTSRAAARDCFERSFSLRGCCARGATFTAAARFLRVGTRVGGPPRNA